MRFKGSCHCGSVAFEVDGLDHELERGWSVQARGRVEVVTAHQELYRIREVADPLPRM